jgi:hypothetical protein
MMLRRVARALEVTTVSCMLLLAAGCNVTSHHIGAGPASAPPATSHNTFGAPVSTPLSTAVGHVTWARSIVDSGTFSDLVATQSGVYAALTPNEHRVQTEQVVRLDRSDGHISARSTLFADAGTISFADHHIWITATSGPTPARAAGEQILYRLDPTTLQTTGRFVLSTTTADSPDDSAGSGQHLWVTVNCTLDRVDPATGAITERLRRPRHVCDLRNLALAGRLLYTTIQPSGTLLVLQQRDASTGRLLDHIDIPDAPAGGLDLTVAGRDLWAGGGFPGATGALYWFATDPLKLLGASGGDGGHGGALGRAAVTLPSLGEFPTVNRSDGTIWAAGFGVVACIDPATGSVRAITTEYTGPTVAGPVVVTSKATWAVTISTGRGRFGIAQLYPPPACRTGSASRN